MFMEPSRETSQGATSSGDVEALAGRARGVPAGQVRGRARVRARSRLSGWRDPGRRALHAVFRRSPRAAP